MRTVRMEKMPVCDLCKKAVATFDAPTRSGPWAYMCPTCFDSQGAPDIGSHLLLAEKHVVSEDVVDGEGEYDGDDYVITCPTCSEERLVEPDADYIFTCEGCGQRVQVPSLF